MRVRLEFGYPVVKKKIIDFAGDIKSFPNYVTYDNLTYEFIAYEKDQTGATEYVFKFGEIASSLVPDYMAIVDIEWAYGGNFNSNKCECGAAYERGFENSHWQMCPLWSK